MGLFSRKQEPAAGQSSLADQLALAKQMQAQALQMQAQFQAVQHGTDNQRPSQSATVPEVGSATWARRVMALIAPPGPGFVKRCSCVVCGAPKKLPSVTAYVYCDYCASLTDFDLRRASEGDTPVGPAYAATVNSAHAASQAAIAAGDREGYRALQTGVYEAYVLHVPMAVSHRAKNDPEYRRAYVEYMAAAAVARAFDPEAQALEAEMKQRVMSLSYTGNMMSPTVEPDSFWPMADTLEKQIQSSRVLYRTAGLAQLDPDGAEHLTGKLAWSGFCQGWLAMIPSDAAAQLLDRAGLTNEYVPVQAEDGQSRHCGGCGANFSALPDARAVICSGCGRKIDLGGAEIPCAACGASMTLPAGADEVACPYCRAQVRRAGIR
jgi:DNA-directed RNA polymerase subunit RPC12/RpoP